MTTKRILLASFLIIAAFLFMPLRSFAQSSSSGSTLTGFDKSTMLIGPHIGLAAFGSAPAFGANFETAVTEPGKAGPGIIGVSGRVDYFGFDDGWAKYTWLAFGVFANYHFAMDSKMWDPFVGLGLGYQNVSVSWASGYEGLSGWGSGVYFSGNAGIRYFFSQGMDARAQLGFGITYLVVGLDFRLS